MTPLSERDDAIAAFLAHAGWGEAALAPLAGDASFRRYVRLRRGATSAMLMDAPPPKEDVRPYCAVARLLGSLGLSAPRILAEDWGRGLLVIEDFGDDTFTRLLATGADEEALYALAVDCLVALNRRFTASGATTLARYDDSRLLAEAALLVDWYLPAITGSPAGAVRNEYLELWQSLLAGARGVPETLVLRDYHVDNLMRLPGRDGVAACGLLDFQDAVLGPMSYDLVSLLEDARRDVPRELATAMSARFLAAFPALDRAAFDRSYALLGAQRNAKIIGIFTRLCVRDGKPAYLAHIPRVWHLLEQDLRHPALVPMARWLDRHVPPEARRVPAAMSAA
ncbi:MAG TPA: phosphotransferase [Stellaceae bacterium]|nr:phosphotransferase [Stellaceae bacterium]